MNFSAPVHRWFYSIEYCMKTVIVSIRFQQPFSKFERIVVSAILRTFSAEVVAQIAHCETVADRLGGGYIYPYVLGGELFHVIYA